MQYSVVVFRITQWNLMHLTSGTSMHQHHSRGMKSVGCGGESIMDILMECWKVYVYLGFWHRRWRHLPIYTFFHSNTLIAHLWKVKLCSQKGIHVINLPYLYHHGLGCSKGPAVWINYQAPSKMWNAGIRCVHGKKKVDKTVMFKIMCLFQVLEQLHVHANITKLKGSMYG